MAARPLVVAAPLLVAILAGCLGGAPSGPPVAWGPGGWNLACLPSSGWGDPCTARATLSNGPANEVWLAANPRDPLNVVAGAKDYNDRASDCVWGGLAVTKDGGATWSNSYIGGTREQREDPQHPLFGYQCVTDPMFTFDAGGLLYYVIEAYGRAPHERDGVVPADTSGLPFHRTLQHPDTGGNTVFIAVSPDGGTTFDPPYRLWDAEGTLALLADKSHIIANPATGTIHFAITQFVGASAGAATQVLVFNSRDHGRSWSGPVIASGTDLTWKFPAMLSAASDGTLYLSWHDWTANRVVLARSLDDGNSFTAPTVVAATEPLFEAPPNAAYRVVTLPVHAVDNSGGEADGTIYMAWMQNVSGHMDILFTRSADGGDTWEEPWLLTDDATANAQFHPAIAVDDRGAVHVTYYDRRHDPADKLVDLTWAISVDGGTTFHHRRVTVGGFDGDHGIHQDGFPFLGDYNGLTIVGGTAYAGWADTRMGRSDVAVAKAVRD